MDAVDARQAMLVASTTVYAVYIAAPGDSLKLSPRTHRVRERALQHGAASAKNLGPGWLIVVIDLDTGKEIAEFGSRTRIPMTDPRSPAYRGAQHANIIRYGDSDGDSDGDGEGEDEDDFDLKGEMEEGFVISDARGGGYRVADSGSYIGSRPSFEEALKLAAQRMEDNKFFPNIFYVNERGNTDLLAIRPKVVKGKVIKVSYKTVRDWV